nr:restriction endonuclease [Novosphingobium marinum]
MVGMVAARGCSLEILPKVDPDAAEDEQAQSVRRRLVRMLDVALGLDLDLGGEAAIHRQNHTLLEVLIRAFADKLLAEVRRGLPRLYRQCEDDLPALRGRLDVTRQFTRNAVRPDRLACRFDQLDADKPLMRVMAAAVVTLGKHARSPETRRKLDELRHVLAEIPLVPVNRLPWKEVRIDRTNRRWESLYRLAQLLLRRDWQATHHAASAPEGLTLLFPMNDLFEKYVAAMMRKALAGSGVEVVDQGGHRACLGAFTGEHLESGEVFRTRPDIILRRRGEVLAIIDTKWKKLARDPLDRKHGVSQADVYQLMAYARLYPTRELMLLYPEVPGQPCGMRKPFGMAGGSERLAIATIDASLEENAIVRHLAKLCRNYCAEMDSAVT